MYYYGDTYSFRCYTDCQETFDIFSLIQKIKKVSFLESIQYVVNLTGKNYVSTIQNYTINDWEWINRLKKKNKIEVNLPVHNENVLELFLPLPHESWLNEGISIETMRKFEIGYYVKDERITIPHRNINKQLVGIRGRALRKEDIEAGKKYIPLMIENKLYNHPTLYNLYGLHKTQDAIRRIRKTMIFEGEKSVLKCEDFYGDNNFTVAVSGSNISNWHIQTLVSLGVEEVFISMDKMYHDHNSDEAYEYSEKLLKLAHKFTPYCRTYILFDKWNLLGYKDSPVDKGKDVLEFLMKNKIEVKTKKGEIA